MPCYSVRNVCRSPSHTAAQTGAVGLVETFAAVGCVLAAAAAKRRYEAYRGIYEVER